MPLQTTCGICGVFVSASYVGGNSDQPGAPNFYRCPNPTCTAGMVKQADGAVYPPAPAGSAVANLPEDVSQAWQEARVAHNVAAYTASEIMCRKILMHVAVDRAGSEQGQKFYEYVNHLESAGYIAAGLKPTVDTIRDRGNTANHELPASTEAQSLQTLRVTQHLLESMYAFAEPGG